MCGERGTFVHGQNQARRQCGAGRGGKWAEKGQNRRSIAVKEEEEMGTGDRGLSLVGRDHEGGWVDQVEKTEPRHDVADTKEGRLKCKQTQAERVRSCGQIKAWGEGWEHGKRRRARRIGRWQIVRASAGLAGVESCIASGGAGRSENPGRWRTGSVGDRRRRGERKS